MDFGEGFASGFAKGNTASSSTGSTTSSKSTLGSKLGSEIRQGVAKIFTGGKSGRSMKSSADAASEYPGLDTGGYGDE